MGGRRASNPRASAAGDDEVAHEQAIGRLALMLVGSVQSLANWWADHQEITRARIAEITMDYAWLGPERLSRGERRRPPSP